jgi:hypothetical protein
MAKRKRLYTQEQDIQAQTNRAAKRNKFAARIFRSKPETILFSLEINDTIYLQYVAEKAWRPNPISRNINFVLRGNNSGSSISTEYQFR